MIHRIPFAEIREKILQSGKINSIELEGRMKEKINELSGLISEEGAAHIIANELGIELYSGKEKLKIKELYSGMRNISTVGRITRKFEVREFAKGDKTGKVASLILGDETGTIRVVFWNDQADLFGALQEDETVLIKNAYVRENNGGKEIHVNEQTEIKVNPEGEIISSVRGNYDFERKNIAQLQDTMDKVEILGTIVQVFDPRFFRVCMECGKKVLDSEGRLSCAEHGEVKTALSCVLNLILDDGTGTIRGVFWRNQMQHLLNKSEVELNTYQENQSSFENVKTDLLGEQLKVRGRVKRNELFDRLEFNVQMVEKANPEEELARLEKMKRSFL